MSGLLGHVYVSPGPDSEISAEIQPLRDWNDKHVFSGGNKGSILLRDTADATYGANWLQSVAAGQILVSAGVAALPVWSSTISLSALTLATGTITASTPALTISQTWNNAAVGFKGMVFDFTVTAAHATSVYLSLENAGVKQFQVGRGTGGNPYAYVSGVIGSGNGPGFFADKTGDSESRCVMSVNLNSEGEISFGPGNGGRDRMIRRDATTTNLHVTGKMLVELVLPTYLYEGANNLGRFSYTGVAGDPAFVSNTGKGFSLYTDNGAVPALVFASTGLATIVGIPVIKGGTSTTQTLTIKPTSGVGAVGSDIIFQVGNDGASEAVRILQNKRVGFGIAAPARLFHFHNADAADTSFQITHSTSGVTNASGVFFGLQAAVFYIHAYDAASTINFNTANLSTATLDNLGRLTLARNGWSTIGGICKITVGDNNSALQIINSGSSNKTWTFYPLGNDLLLHDGGAIRVVFEDLGNVGFGVANPSGVVHIKAGTVDVPPLRFNSGTLLTIPLAGSVEFLTDAFYATITTGAARKTLSFLESPVFTGVPAAPTAAAATNTTQLATTAFVQGEIAAKAPLASPVFTGTVDSPAYKVGGVAGANFGPAAPASITIVNGLVTACS